MLDAVRALAEFDLDSPARTTWEVPYRLTAAGEQWFAALDNLTAEVRAGGLPQGSVVAIDTLALLRIVDGIGSVWSGTDNRRYDDENVDQLLTDGAAVLRHGPR